MSSLHAPSRLLPNRSSCDFTGPCKTRFVADKAKLFEDRCVLQVRTPSGVILIKSARPFLTLQAGRGLAATLVVIHHVALLTGKVEFIAGHLGVEFFFVLSGMVILLAHFSDLDQPGKLRTFLWKRFRRVYPVYWIVLLPQLAFILLRQRSTSLYQRNPWVVVSNLLLVHLNSTGVTVTVAWTLFHEVLFYAFFALLLLDRRLGGVVMVLWLTASVFFFQHQDTYWAFVFSPLHLIFAFGMFAAWVVRRGPVPRPYLLLSAGLLLFARASYISNTLSTAGDANNLFAGLGAMLAMLGLVEFERRGHITVPAWLILLGDASYSIYLLHYPFLYAATPKAMRWFSAVHLPLALWIVAATLISLGLGLAFHLLVELPLLHRLGTSNRRASVTPEPEAA